MSKIKTVLMFLLTMFIIIILIFVLDGIIEDHSVMLKIKDFKSNAVLVYSDYENSINYYEITSEESTRTFDYKYCYDNDTSNDYFGDIGDITITDRNPLREYPLSELLTPIVRLLKIGHATINYYGNKLIESEGKDLKEVKIEKNYWLETTDAHLIVGLKVKTDSKTKENASEKAKSWVGLKYNWNFLVSSDDKKNCTGLVNDAYGNFKIKLNHDGLFVTGNDFITSKDTYIYYLQEKVFENNKTQTNIYYLK